MPGYGGVQKCVRKLAILLRGRVSNEGQKYELTSRPKDSNPAQSKVATLVQR